MFLSDQHKSSPRLPYCADELCGMARFANGIFLGLKTNYPTNKQNYIECSIKYLKIGQIFVRNFVSDLLFCYFALVSLFWCYFLVSTIVTNLVVLHS